MQTLSTKGRDALISEEGVVRHAYNDPAGHATFGVGHLLHHGEVTEWDQIVWGNKEHPRDMWTVRKVLARDLKPFEEAVRDVLGRETSAHKFDALVSFAFNIGRSAFLNSTCADFLRMGPGDGNYRKAADAMLLFDNPPILRARRERERIMFLEGRYVRLGE